jgi:hypothetical protein
MSCEKIDDCSQGYWLEVQQQFQPLWDEIINQPINCLTLSGQDSWPFPFGMDDSQAGAADVGRVQSFWAGVDSKYIDQDTLLKNFKR